MKYTALIDFIDTQDMNCFYHAGDIFPREGHEVTNERAAELSSSANKLGKPVIVEIKEPQTVKQEQPIVEETPAIEEKPVEKKTRGRKKTT